MKTVIGVCGYSGAGKSTFCREMAARFGLPVLATGEIVRREAAARGHPLTPESIARVSDEIREETGGRFLRILEPDLARGFETAPAVLLDCLREESDLQTLRELADRVHLIAIAAPGALRAARALGRGRPGDPATEAELRALYATEQRLGVARLLANAGSVLDNDGDLEGFIARAAKVVEGILAAAPGEGKW
jgi:dephospho-CoA kinase